VNTSGAGPQQQQQQQQVAALQAVALQAGAGAASAQGLSLEQDAAIRKLALVAGGLWQGGQVPTAESILGASSVAPELLQQLSSYHLQQAVRSAVQDALEMQELVAGDSKQVGLLVAHMVCQQFGDCAVNLQVQFSIHACNDIMNKWHIGLVHGNTNESKQCWLLTACVLAVLNVVQVEELVVGLLLAHN
jgi:hypothetical protein